MIWSSDKSIKTSRGIFPTPGQYFLGVKLQNLGSKEYGIRGFQIVAERQGFEPWKDLHPCRFSRPVHSTTLPSLRNI